MPGRAAVRPRRSPEGTVTAAQVTAFRLRRHHLLERAAPNALLSVVDDMAGAQAQLGSAAALSIGARIRDLTATVVERALGPERTLVRAWCMRRTVYVVPARSLAVYVRGSARRAEREHVWMRGRGVRDDQLAELVGAVLEALDEPRTRGDVAERVGARLGRPVRGRSGGGWGEPRVRACVDVHGIPIPGEYLLHLAAVDGVVCAGPPRGGQATFVRADAWLPHWTDLSPEVAETELLRRYLRAFGPARPEDFAWWTGMRLSDVRPVWGRIADSLAEVEFAGHPAWILRPDLAELCGPEALPLPPRLLPYFDAFLLGHGEERNVVPPSHHAAVYRPQGWVAPVVLVGGKAVGTWKNVSRGSGVDVRVVPFGPGKLRISSALRSEANEMARFLGGTKGEISVGPVDGRAPRA